MAAWDSKDIWLMGKREIRKFWISNRLKEDDQKVASKNCNSLLYRNLYTKNTMSRDMILRIASLCENFNLADIFIS